MKYEFGWFSREEVTCGGRDRVLCDWECGKRLDDDYIAVLNEIRQDCGFALKLTSSIRCMEHNSKVGSKPTSKHILGIAVDIKLDDSSKVMRVMDVAREKGFTCFGRYSWGLHLDTRITKNNEPMMFWGSY